MIRRPIHMGIQVDPEASKGEAPLIKIYSLVWSGEDTHGNGPFTVSRGVFNATIEWSNYTRYIPEINIELFNILGLEDGDRDAPILEPCKVKLSISTLG